MSAEESNNNNNNESNNSATVRFNVGGTVYEVSRSLLEQFPDTMLSRMVSETWLDCSQGGDNDDQKKESPIFVDRDGDRFRYVLDYMRDGQKVTLPVTVPKQGFLKDLEYYGFENMNADTITTESSYLVYTKTFHKMRALDFEVRERINTEHDIATLANYCFVRLMYSGLFKFCVARDHGQCDFIRGYHRMYKETQLLRKLRDTANSISVAGSVRWVHFDKCLSEYGLKSKSSERGIARRQFESPPVTVTLETIDGK